MYKTQLDISRVVRGLLLKIMNGLSTEELNKVPEGFNNSIIWNIAHVVVTQQLLVYKLSNTPMTLSNDFVDTYKKGTKTESDASQEVIDFVKESLLSTVDQTEKDITKNAFGSYTTYPTSTGFVIESLEDAINFNNFHEGIHLGYVMALRRALK